jgi:hypothetical protein
MVFHILKKSFVAKGCKFSLYALKFIGVSNCNRVPSKRSILIIIIIIIIIINFLPFRIMYDIWRENRLKSYSALWSSGL